MNGREWVVEAFGCEPERLCNSAVLHALFNAMIADLALHPVGEAQWHTFPPPGGVTGVCILAESHLTVHTFPEHGSLCLNLFCCTPREPWDWAPRLAEHVGATHVSVRVLEREYVEVSAPGAAR
ncbi:MAG: S-adenosylmethionine decarboxylase [Phycisphaerae bacterium]|nr:S-adenosylmethionine decarboxylase [Gemmatimonadaceae bacterium]